MVYLLEHSEELGKLFLVVSSAHPGMEELVIQHWTETLGLDLLLPLLGILDGAGDLVQVLVCDPFSFDLLHFLGCGSAMLLPACLPACPVARSGAGAGG